MIHQVDDRFLAEARRYAFRFACGACVHFEPVDQSCSNGYPSAPHRQDEPRRSEKVVFCKLFELA